MSRLSVLALALALALAAPVLAAPLGSAFTYQGRLAENGAPANGLFDFEFCLFDAPAPPANLIGACQSADAIPALSAVPVEAGEFTLMLDFGAASFVGEERYLEVRVRPDSSTPGGFTPLAPRQLLTATPEALRARAAGAAPWSGLSGVPGGFVDAIDNDSGGTVTSVSAGAGLSGGPITASGTLSIAPGGVGATQIDSTAVQRRLSGNCAANQKLLGVAQDGSIVCGSDANSGGTVTSVATGTGLSGGPINTSGTLAVNFSQVQARVSASCTAGDYLRGIAADGSPLCAALPGLTRSTVVDSVGDVGSWTAIAIGSDGLPIISYHDASPLNQNLKVAHCEDPACVQPATITTVDATGNTGLYTDIAIGADGLAVISYVEAGGRLVRVAKCINTACTGSATRTTIATLNLEAIEPGTSIAIGLDGNPVVSFQDPADDDLRVIKCANPACTGNTAHTLVDPSVSNVGKYSSIVVPSDGLPVIAYVDDSSDDLKIARCSAADCSGTATRLMADTSGTIGGQTSIALNGLGRVVIGYHDTAAGDLKFVRCTSQDCASRSGGIVDSPTGVVGFYNAVAVGGDGVPILAYYGEVEGPLRFARCSSNSCDGTAQTTTLDGDLSGFHVSMAIGSDGLPVIAHYDNQGDNLKVVRCGTRTCQ